MNEVINWPFTIVFFVALLGLLVTVMLLTVNQTDIFPNRLLAAYLGCFSLLALNYSLMSTSFFLQFPHTWRILAWASFFLFCPFWLFICSQCFGTEFLVSQEGFMVVSTRPHSLFMPHSIFCAVLPRKAGNS